MTLVLIILAWFGLAFGSFVNAFVWRLHEQTKRAKSPQLGAKSKKAAAKDSKLSALSTKDLSILRGRSMCPNCKHRLSPLDLIPVFSWAALRGKCRYCKKPISWQYPVVELAAAVVFAASYLLWPIDLNGAGPIILFITWLAASVGLLALLVYDARWMLLPSKIIYPTLAVAAAGRVVYIIGFEHRKVHAIIMWGLSLAAASGIFWLLYQVSSGKWIGYGDVRLGFITGTIVAAPAKSLLVIFIGSILGTIYAVPALVSGSKKAASKLPYGPFLIAATAVVVLFGDSILNWYDRVFLP